MVIKIILGLVLLFAGAELLVGGSVAVARRLGVSPLLIGLTLVGFGTSTPELVTSLEAAMRGSPGIAVGNVVGSNIANILLILGTASLISPIASNPRAFRRDAIALLGSAILLALASLSGIIGAAIGVVFICLLPAYVGLAYLGARGTGAVRLGGAGDAPGGTVHTLPVALLLAAGGVATTIGGAYLLVDGALDLSQTAGVSETVVGLTIVAVGTSLPELATSVVAAFRRQGDIAFGNVIGSNIYNIFGIVGVTALVQPLAIPPRIAQIDIWVLIAATVLLIVFAVTGRRLSRGEGATFLVLYVAYTAVLAIRGAA